VPIAFDNLSRDHDGGKKTQEPGEHWRISQAVLHMPYTCNLNTYMYVILHVAR
jgi:hypothetical protein